MTTLLEKQATVQLVKKFPYDAKFRATKHVQTDCPPGQHVCERPGNKINYTSAFFFVLFCFVLFFLDFNHFDSTTSFSFFRFTSFFPTFSSTQGGAAKPKQTRASQSQQSIGPLSLSPCLCLSLPRSMVNIKHTVVCFMLPAAHYGLMLQEASY